MGFIESRVAEEKLIGDVAFPKTLLPGAGSDGDLVKLVLAESGEERLALGLNFSMMTASDAEAGSGIVINKSWKSAPGTEDEAEAAKRAPETLSCGSIRFLEEGRAEITIGPINPIGVFGEKRAWLVPLLGYNKTMENVSNKFSDRSAVPEQALIIYKEILEENCVDIKWQNGDVLLFDKLFSTQGVRENRRGSFLHLCANDFQSSQ